MQTWQVLPRYTDRNVIPIGSPRMDGAIDVFAEVNGGGGVVGDTEGDRRARLMAAAPALAEAAIHAASLLADLAAGFQDRELHEPPEETLTRLRDALRAAGVGHPFAA